MQVERYQYLALAVGGTARSPAPEGGRQFLLLFKNSFLFKGLPYGPQVRRPAFISCREHRKNLDTYPVNP
jgi:hypothetical protein